MYNSIIAAEAAYICIYYKYTKVSPVSITYNPLVYYGYSIPHCTMVLVNYRKA